VAQDRINLKKITYRISYPEQPAYIMADTEKLKIAFLNIIINAIEGLWKKLRACWKISLPTTRTGTWYSLKTTAAYRKKIFPACLSLILRPTRHDAHGKNMHRP